MPFYRTRAKLSFRDSLSLNALLWVTAIVLALATIELGSAIAMNALLGGASICLVFALCAFVGLTLFGGRSRLPPDIYLGLGK